MSDYGLVITHCFLKEGWKTIQVLPHMAEGQLAWVM